MDPSAILPHDAFVKSRWLFLAQFTAQVVGFSCDDHQQQKRLKMFA